MDSQVVISSRRRIDLHGMCVELPVRTRSMADEDVPTEYTKASSFNALRVGADQGSGAEANQQSAKIALPTANDRKKSLGIKTNLETSESRNSRRGFKRNLISDQNDLGSCV